MDTVMTKDEDLREKIKTFIVKMDRMEARVKEVETIAATVPRLEAKLQKVEGRVESTEQSIKTVMPAAGRARALPSASPPVKAFVGGASIGLLILGLIAAVWLGLF